MMARGDGGPPLSPPVEPGGLSGAVLNLHCGVHVPDVDAFPN